MNMDAELLILCITVFVMRVDDTLFAKMAGYVKFERLGKDKTKVSIYEER